MSTIDIGVIGCGERIRYILKMLLPQSDRLRLRAVDDPSKASIAKVREEFGADVEACPDYPTLLRKREIQWVFVGSWNCFHAEHAIAAMEAGKHVFCEKPLATTLEDCLAVQDAVLRTKRMFAFGLVLRYSPHYRRIKEFLTTGKLGKLVSFEFNETLKFPMGGCIFANWRGKTVNAGSHVLEKCCHDLDIANWMCESLPVRIACFGGRRVFTPENRHLLHEFGPDRDGKPGYRAWSEVAGDPFESDLLDHQVVILEYANGVKATFHSNAHAGMSERRLYLLGTHGGIRSDAYTKTISYQRIGHNMPIEDVSSDAKGIHAGGDEFLAKHMIDSMLHGIEPVATIDHALRSALVAFAIDEAQRTAQIVDLRPMWQRAGIDPSTAGKW